MADIFAGGDFRRLNTMFKLHYQAWLLLAVLGGFGLWYVGSRWDRKVLAGRVGVAAWTALLIVALGAVSYYPLAAITSRLAVNRAAWKTRPDEIGHWITKFREAVNGDAA